MCLFYCGLMTEQQDYAPKASLLWRLFIALAALLTPTLPSHADDVRGELVIAARAFDESALRLGDDNARPIGVRKWRAPIALRFANASRAPGLVEPSRKAIQSIAGQTPDIAVADAAVDDANFIVFFDENESASGKNGCHANVSSKSWAISRSELKINPAFGASIDGCIIHEAMHAFGFLSHPHGADSVLSYVYRRRALTPLDIHLVRTLHDPRLKPGTKPAAASQLACRILGERLRATASDVDTVCRDRKGPSP